MTTVLVVEDDARVRKALGRLLALHHVETIATNSVAAALGALRNSVQEIDGAIVDIGLPDGSGIDVVMRLVDNQIAVMVLTALDSAELQAMSQAAGVRYVRKAFDDVELQTVAFLASLLRWRLEKVAREVGRRRKLSPPAIERVLSVASPSETTPDNGVDEVSAEVSAKCEGRSLAQVACEVATRAEMLRVRSVRLALAALPPPPGRRRAQPPPLLDENGFVRAVGTALRCFHDDGRLRKSALARRTRLFHDATLHEVRLRMLEARDGFDDVGKNGLRGRILDRAFLRGNGKQLTVAAEVGVSYATVRREMREAVEQLARGLWARELEARGQHAS